MRRTVQQSIWIIGGVILILGIGGYLLHRPIVVSQMETNAPTSASYSSAMAKELGKFVRMVDVEPGYFTYKGQRVDVKDAWIERVYDVKYFMLFFPEITYRDEYRLAIVPGVPSSHEYDFSLYDQKSRYFGEQSRGIGESYVLTYDLGKDYPDTLNCQVMVDREETDSFLTIVLREPGS